MQSVVVPPRRMKKVIILQAFSLFLNQRNKLECFHWLGLLQGAHHGVLHLLK
jgi:hypothetical protein